MPHAAFFPLQNGTDWLTDKHKLIEVYLKLECQTIPVNIVFSSILYKKQSCHCFISLFSGKGFFFQVG